MANKSEVSAVPSIQYSDKLQSLLCFLDEHCDPKYDNNDDFSSSGGGAGSPHSTRTGLADITNDPSARVTEEKGKGAFIRPDKEEQEDCRNYFDAARKSSAGPHVMRERKYIWDDWCEVEVEPETLSEEVVDELSNPKELATSAREQLEELKSMSNEIQTRAAAMKIELEQKSKLVEELHSVRVESEAEHVQKMKAAKQEWMKRLEAANAELNMVLNKHETLKGTLQNNCELLEKDVTRFQAEIEKLSTSEQDICERLRRDGMRHLEESRKSWQHLEREELKKRDQQMSPKLKRDAAKAVEPRLRLLMEKNKNEVARLEREKSRDVDCYRLELYKQANIEFKREAKQIRDNERKRNEQLEAEWIVKLENSGLRHEAETKRLHQEHEQRAAMMKQQFNADKQKCVDVHENNKDEARVVRSRQMEDIRVKHERELANMEDEYSEKIAQRQLSCVNDLKQWKVSREAELKEEEDQKLRDAKTKMKAKIQSQIDLVKRKLKEEKMEQGERTKEKVARNRAAIKEKYDAEVKTLKCRLEKTTKEGNILQQREAEESEMTRELQDNLLRLEQSVQETEKQATSQEKRLAVDITEFDRQLANIQKEGEQRMMQARCLNEVVKKELGSVIENHPKQLEKARTMLETLKTDNERELSSAKAKVDAMIETKQSLLERESAKLLHLEEETTQLQNELERRRIIKVVGGGTQ